MNIPKFFIIQQFMHMVSLCETIMQSVFMFVYPAFQLTCYANIQYTMIPIGKNINEIHFFITDPFFPV